MPSRASVGPFNVGRRAVLSWPGMRSIRRHLALIIGGWLVSQTFVLTVVPASMCAGAAVSTPEQACTCSHDGGQECPMHHRTAAKSKSSCSCRSTTDTTTLAIASLLGPIAVLPPAINVAAVFLSTDLNRSLVAPPIDVPALPEAPPPRAEHLHESHATQMAMTHGLFGRVLVGQQA